jgi:hypothetical protein
MTRILFVIAALATSTSAFAASTYADPNGPIRSGNKCWAISDARGFGYWDACASKQEVLEIVQQKGINTVVDIAKSQAERGTGEGSSSGGGSGGSSGGGGNSR